MSSVCNYPVLENSVSNVTFPPAVLTAGLPSLLISPAWLSLMGAYRNYLETAVTAAPAEEGPGVLASAHLLSDERVESLSHRAALFSLRSLPAPASSNSPLLFREHQL